jgi:hypothetical protein
MELGKDIIAISPEGTPCAYQLKTSQGRRISLGQWNSEINQQAFNLVVGQIVHPSIDSSRHHQAYLVTNRDLEEEVSRAIDDMNRQWQTSGQGHLRLRTITRGQLIQKAKNLGIGFMPTETVDAKLIFELFLEDGKGFFPKDKLSHLFESILNRGIKSRPSTASGKRAISSIALLCSIATSSFSNSRNFLAEIEAWTVFLSYLLAFVEKWRLSEQWFKDEFEVARQVIFNSLYGIFEELKNRTHFVEGDALLDPFFYKARITWLISLMSIFALWIKSEEKESEEEIDIIRGFCLDSMDKLYLYSEAAVPQFLAFYWFYRKIDGSMKPDFLIRDLISFICEAKNPKKEIFLANSYYEAEDILPYLIGIPDEPLNDNFKGDSYTLEALVHLFVRRNWKQTMKTLWPEITKISITTFIPEKRWHFFRWRNRAGQLKTTKPKLRQDWNELKSLSMESSGNDIPPTIKKYPILLII